MDNQYFNRINIHHRWSLVRSIVEWSSTGRSKGQGPSTWAPTAQTWTRERSMRIAKLKTLSSTTKSTTMLALLRGSHFSSLWKVKKYLSNSYLNVLNFINYNYLTIHNHKIKPFLNFGFLIWQLTLTYFDNNPKVGTYHVPTYSMLSMNDWKA